MNRIAIVWLILSLVTIMTRVSPIFFSKSLKDKDWMKKISDQLPCTILILLVIHIIIGRYESEASHDIATLVGLLATLCIHYFKRHTLISIFSGVAGYAITAQLLS